MTATGQNLEMYRGDTKEIVVTVTDDSNNILNITGGTINYVVYKITPYSIVINKTTASGVTLTNPTSGIFQISLLPVDTESLLGYYQHEAELTDISGNISTLFTGKFTVIDSKA